MSRLNKKFFKALLEQDEPRPVPAVDADVEDDREALQGELSDPDDIDQLGGDSAPAGSEEVIEPDVDYHADLNTLQSWIEKLTDFKDYLNSDSPESILNRLREEAKLGTLFDAVSDSTKNDILDVSQRLASIIETLKNHHIEKHK